MNNKDSWGQLELDACKDMCEYFNHQDERDYCQGCRAFLSDVKCETMMAMELVQRAKVLAGVDSKGGNMA